MSYKYYYEWAGRAGPAFEYTDPPQILGPLACPVHFTDIIKKSD